MKENIYISLDEARLKLKERWQDKSLKKKVEEELGHFYMQSFCQAPRGVTFRQLCSPDNGFLFFYQASRYVGANPLILEYHDDIFTHINEEKKGLGRLRVTIENGERGMIDIMDFHRNEKKALRGVTIKSGESLPNFHRNLFKISGYAVDFLENSDWFNKIGKAKDYYYYLLLHFVSHGVLFETFLDEGDSNEDAFTENVVKPALNKIQKKFGLHPLISRLYSANQSDDESFYWWSYPPNVNEYILRYAKDNNLIFKDKIID